MLKFPTETFHIITLRLFFATRTLFTMKSFSFIILVAAPIIGALNTSIQRRTISLKPTFDFSNAQKLPGVIAPTGFFDPLGFSKDISPADLKRYREAELTHGRVAMLASVGYIVGESGATPLFDGSIAGPANNQFWQVPTEYWPIFLLLIAVLEIYRANRGWLAPNEKEKMFRLRPEYTPGDLGFDPFGLKPEDPEELKAIQTKELQHSRLAMLAAAGMMAQELQTGEPLGVFS